MAQLFLLCRIAIILAYIEYYIRITHAWIEDNNWRLVVRTNSSNNAISYYYIHMVNYMVLSVTKQRMFFFVFDKTYPHHLAELKFYKMHVPIAKYSVGVMWPCVYGLPMCPNPLSLIIPGMGMGIWTLRKHRHVWLVPYNLHNREMESI